MLQLWREINLASHPLLLLSVWFQASYANTQAATVFVPTNETIPSLNVTMKIKSHDLHKMINGICNTLISIPYYYDLLCFCPMYHYHHHCHVEFCGFEVHKTCFNFSFFQEIFSNLLSLPCGNLFHPKAHLHVPMLALSS